jgi:hypothetical protein
MDPSSPVDPFERPRCSVAEAVGTAVTALLCLLFGHEDGGCLPFCLWCGSDLTPK